MCYALDQKHCLRHVYFDLDSSVILASTRLLEYIHITLQTYVSLRFILDFILLNYFIKFVLIS